MKFDSEKRWRYNLPMRTWHRYSAIDENPAETNVCFPAIRGRIWKDGDQAGRALPNLWHAK
jgi:hypothetical protein